MEPPLSNRMKDDEGRADTDLAIPEAAEGRPIEELERLYQAYAPRVFRIAAHIVGDRHAAEDITQDVFLKVYEARSSFKGRADPYTWIYRVTVNVSINWVKRHRRMETTSEPIRASGVDDPEELLIREEEQDELAGYLNELSVDHRACLVLKDVEELSYENIAKILEIPVGTATSRVARARQRFLRILRRRRG